MLKVRVLDEFAKLRSVIIHDPENAIDITAEELEKVVQPEELREHPETRPVSKARVKEQHARLRELFDRFGVAVQSPDPQPWAFCQVFTRDPCFVLGETLFVGALRDGYRHSETTGLAQLRAQVDRVTALSGEGARIEGGDIFILQGGQLVLVGMNRHTSEAAVRWLASEVEQWGARVVRVPHQALHLDCCLAPLPNGEALFTPGKLPDTSLEILRPLFGRLRMLDKLEGMRHLAANMFWLDPENVVSSTANPKTNEVLRSLGYRVHALDFSDLVAMWGSVRCVTCPLERE
jgi:dimethylargininase